MISSVAWLVHRPELVLPLCLYICLSVSWLAEVMRAYLCYLVQVMLNCPLFSTADQVFTLTHSLSNNVII